MSTWSSKDVESRAEECLERQWRPLTREEEAAISPEQYHLEQEISRVKGQIIEVDKQLAAPILPFRREQQLLEAKTFLTAKLQELETK